MGSSGPSDWRDVAVRGRDQGGRYSRAVEGAEPASGCVVAVREPGREGTALGPVRLERGRLAAAIVIDGVPVGDLGVGARLRLGPTALVELAPPDAPGSAEGGGESGGLVEVGAPTVVVADVLEPGVVAPGDEVALEAVTVPLADVLDLHSFRPEETAKVVTEYLAEAHRVGLEEVRIIHG